VSVDLALRLPDAPLSFVSGARTEVHCCRRQMVWLCQRRGSLAETPGMSLERRQPILRVVGRLVVCEPGLAPATRRMCVDGVYCAPSGMRAGWEQLQPGRALARCRGSKSPARGAGKLVQGI
jgi:hypothetical protein